MLKMDYCIWAIFDGSFWCEVWITKLEWTWYSILGIDSEPSDPKQATGYSIQKLLEFFVEITLAVSWRDNYYLNGTWNSTESQVGEEAARLIKHFVSERQKQYSETKKRMNILHSSFNDLLNALCSKELISMENTWVWVNFFFFQKILFVYFSHTSLYYKRFLPSFASAGQNCDFRKSRGWLVVFFVILRRLAIKLSIFIMMSQMNVYDSDYVRMILIIIKYISCGIPKNDSIVYRPVNNKQFINRKQTLRAQILVSRWNCLFHDKFNATTIHYVSQITIFFKLTKWTIIVS